MSVDKVINNFEEWLQKNNLDFLYKAHYDLLTIDLYYQTSLQNNSFIGSEDNDYVILSEKGEATAYYPAKTLSTTTLLDAEVLKSVLERSKAAQQKYQVFVQKYKEAEIQALDVLEFFEQYCALYIELVACFRTTRPAYIDPLVEKLKKLVLANHASEELISSLLISEHDDGIRLEQRDWMTLLQKEMASREDLKNHATSYPWLFPAVYDYEIALSNLANRYKIDVGKRVERIEEYQKAQTLLRANIEKKKQYLEHTPSEEVLQLVETIAKLSEDRTYFKLALAGMSLRFGTIFKKIAALAHLEPTVFYNSYTIDDITNLLLHTTALSPEVVNQRNDYYAYIVRNFKKEVSTDSAYKDSLKKYFSASAQVHISGVSACPGIVRGVARVLQNSEIKHLTLESLEGKILITTMTDPSIMPFIRNCLALVTDQGGLTSHAAIVSREMHIPCIVGTRNGTEVIKDGSMIEVNADRGDITVLRP